MPYKTSYMPNPFADGELTEMACIYNKNFNGLDMNFPIKLAVYYKQTSSSKVYDILTNLIGKELTELFIHEYIYDVNPNTGKPNKFSVLHCPKEVSDLRLAISKIIENKDKISAELRV